MKRYLQQQPALPPELGEGGAEHQQITARSSATEYEYEYEFVEAVKPKHASTIFDQEEDQEAPATHTTHTTRAVPYCVLLP